MRGSDEYRKTFVLLLTYTSAPTADPFTISCLAQNLTDGLGRTKQEVDKEIIAYRWHNDLDRLVELFQRHGEFLVVAAAYVLGYTDGLESPLNELSADAANALAGSYFEPTWNAMHKALRDMRKLYPDDWKSPDIIKPLSQVMENYYSDMGLILSDTDDGGCYISIPMKPETNPYLLKLTLPSPLLPREA